MICPHCAKSLLRRERTGNVCSYCKRSYAMDPKTNALGLNDLRVRRFMDKLTEQGRLAVTPGQLWYALSRRKLSARAGSGSGCVMPLIVGVLLLVVAASTGNAVPAVLGGVFTVAAIVVALTTATPFHKGVPPIRRAAFASAVLDPWRRTYGSLPTGLVDDGPPRRQLPRGDKGVLLCHDYSAALFLAEAGLPRRHGLAVALDPQEALRHRGPVVVLHDASAAGLLLVAHVRQAQPPRPVVDAGMPLRTMRSLRGAVPVREDRPGQDVMDELTRTGTCTDDELGWLAKGWSYPLVSVPPAKLLEHAERAVERLAELTDPDRRDAAALGFLSWPEPGGAA
ncbi:hypothetical protein AB0M28_04665 [Streptomyces sp. NPDC051940]|uniref:hypothetical protein n=1 Tax=Streptomyces sp. NPDC051940 TaxID=3155675 RepID=UPI003413A571